MTALSDLQIANMALGDLGITDPLLALTGTRAEVTWVNTHLESAKTEVLKASHWSFAKTRLALTDITATLVEAPVDWEYAYTYPADCATPIRIWNGYPEPEPAGMRVPYEVGVALVDSDPDVPTQIILTDEDDAELVYITTAFVTAMQPLAFQKAIAALLAAEIAISITKNPQMAQAMRGLYSLRLQQAIADDKNERQVHSAPESRFIRAR